MGKRFCFTLSPALVLMFVLSHLLVIPTMGQSRPADETAAVRKVLDDQVAAWNTGRLEEFMKGYWRSEELTFFSGGKRLQGWEATLERYRQTYQAGGKEMGHLDFSNLDIRLLGPAKNASAAVVRGEWKLQFRDGRTAGGIYTLIFRRFSDGWKIIHDHTSANQ